MNVPSACSPTTIFVIALLVPISQRDKSAPKCVLTLTPLQITQAFRPFSTYRKNELASSLAMSISIQSHCSKVYFNEMQALAMGLQVAFAISGKRAFKAWNLTTTFDAVTSA